MYLIEFRVDLKGDVFVDKELVDLLLQLGLGVVVVMLAIIACTLLTPKLAKLIEKRHPADNPNPERVDNDEVEPCESPPEVRGAFDAQKEEYDLNYKIYNKDIYGVDFKHGKEKRKNG